MFFGYLKERRGTEVDLVRSRKIWSWKGANTVAEIALHGVTGGKVAEPVTQTVLGVIEVIDCTEASIASLESAKWST